MPRSIVPDPFLFGRSLPLSWRHWLLLVGTSPMKIKLAGLLLLWCASTALADSYSALLKRYEKQIGQQERQLKSLHLNLEEKERDVNRWRNRAEDAKAAWSEAS